MNVVIDRRFWRDPPDGDALFEDIACSLEQKGYFVRPNVLPVELSDCLLNYQSQVTETRFHEAGVGRGRKQAQNSFVRRDKIHWLVEDDAIWAPWLDWTARLKDYLNRRLFLGLFSFESHLAYYESGDFYKRHYDAFKGGSNRVISLVTYLNRSWLAQHGGELVMYSPEKGEELFKVVPELGTLVLFLSEEFPHEVLAAERERYSVAGWYRINGSSSEHLDPPR